MAAHLTAVTQVSSAHPPDLAAEPQADVLVRRDVLGSGAEGGQQQTGGAVWTSRCPRTPRLLPVRPEPPAPPVQVSLAQHRVSVSTRFPRQDALQGALGGAGQPSGL